jgi:hypothetical protein
MRKTILILLAFIFATGTAVSIAQEKTPPPEAEPFWTYITKTNPYEKWQMWPGKDGMYPGTSPHGAFLKLYLNEVAYEAAKGNNPMPAGAILVKENYGEDKGKLMAVTPMYKVEGYNPDGGDWFWAKYGPDGAVEDAGKVEGCIQCHRTQEDWLFTNKEQKQQ